MRGNCRDVRSNTETTARRRGQAVQRYKFRFCASEVLARCWSTTIGSGLETAVHGKDSPNSCNCRHRKLKKPEHPGIVANSCPIADRLA